jgi:hypothetical protein
MLDITVQKVNREIGPPGDLFRRNCEHARGKVDSDDTDIPVSPGQLNRNISRPCGHVAHKLPRGRTNQISQDVTPVDVPAERQNMILDIVRFSDVLEHSVQMSIRKERLNSLGAAGTLSAGIEHLGNQPGRLDAT